MQLTIEQRESDALRTKGVFRWIGFGVSGGRLRTHGPPATILLIVQFIIITMRFTFHLLFKLVLLHGQLP